MFTFVTRPVPCLFVALMALGLGACATSEPPVNRVQENVVDKLTFSGEWYSLQTVIDAPYGAGYTFVGEQGSLEKIEWEIQERFLLARRSFEHIAGSEPQGLAGETEENAAVAVYAIESHFDIRRQYNPVTGEESNVVYEDTQDRPWHQRKYMRVDWSKNLITDNSFLVLAKLFDGIDTEPVSYYVQNLDADHAHRPKFETVPGIEGVGYIDLVQKMFVKPKTVQVPGYDNPLPSCFLMNEAHLDCAPGEITVRNSFLKVDPSRDYQPMEYTGDRMDRFGYFVTDRPGYDEAYGAVQAAKFRFANRHNIWVQSHRLDDAGNPIACTEANAEKVCGGGGSVCDLGYAKAYRNRTDSGVLEGLCTMPYREREIRPIAYHLSTQFPEDLIPDAQHFTAEWNRAFSETVSSLREQECLTDGGDAAACGELRSDDLSVFVLCHNPVTEEDHEACGAPGTSAQIGDLRHSLIGWVNDPHVSSPLGYGPSAADPETGEIIMANAFVYGAAMETLTTFARDIIALLNGALDENAVINGENVEDWVKHMKAPGASSTGKAGDDHHIHLDGSDVERINRAMNFDWARGRGLGARGQITPPQNLGDLVSLVKQSRTALFEGGAFGNGTGSGFAQMQNLRGTDIEDMLVGPEMLLRGGVDPRTAILDEEVLDRASPLRGLDAGALDATRRMRDRIQEQACMVFADFADDGLIGLARAIQDAVANGTGSMTWYGKEYTLVDKNGVVDYEAVRTMLRHPIFDAVTAHEVGHTLGLRHNFSGSYDAWNYLPQYWELRDDGNMGPRYVDATTPEERDGRIREFQYSTVMDYGNNFVVTDAEGIGHYDVAAIKMGYGDLVEVFTEVPPANVTAIGAAGFLQRAGWPVVLKPESLTGGTLAAFRYTDYPSLAGNLEARRDVAYTDLVALDSLSQIGISEPSGTPQGEPAVPYMFCSDERADLSPECFRYDAGADAYESLQSIMDSYYNYYIFNAFGRGRLGFDVNSYAGRVSGRYFAKLQKANQIYTLYRGVFEDIFGDGVDAFVTAEEGMGAWTTGVGASYQLLTQVILTPEPGAYAPRTRPDGTSALVKANQNFGAQAFVDSFVGRPLDTSWDQDLGYFWFDQVKRAGYFFDKVAAIQMLVDPRTNFLGRDTSADVRRYAISFYSSFPDSLTGLLRGVQAEDWKTIGPRTKANTTSDLVYPDPLSFIEQDMVGTPIDPGTSFSIQLYSAVYGLALIQETYSENFVNSARIFVKGSPNGVELDPSVPTVEFVDPTSGLIYVAASNVVDGKEQGVGAQMINYANAMKAEGSTAALQKYIDNLDLARRIGWHFTYGN